MLVAICAIVFAAHASVAHAAFAVRGHETSTAVSRLAFGLPTQRVVVDVSGSRQICDQVLQSTVDERRIAEVMEHMGELYEQYLAGRSLVDGGLPALGLLLAAIALLGWAAWRHSLNVDQVAFDGDVLAVLGIADPLKPEAKEAVAALRRMKVDVVMLTGDSRKTAEAVARAVGFEHVVAEVLPDRKVAEVKRLQEQGKVVAMVGDGINDAPALLQADVGIAIGTGTDIAMEASDITLMRGDPRAAVAAIALARRTMRLMRQNLFWAFVYNVIGIPLAAAGLLSPIIASAAMAFSSVSVVGNSLRLRRFHV